MYVHVTQIVLVVFFCPKDKVAVKFKKKSKLGGPFLLLNNRILTMYQFFMNKNHYHVRSQTRSWYAHFAIDN